MKLIHLAVFLLVYLKEVAVSTFRLSVLVMRPQIRLSPCFVEVPLDLDGETARFLFACLITMTPGTMSVGLDNERRVLIVHLLDSQDPDASVREMKDVFERPLIRIFGRGATT